MFDEKKRPLILLINNIDGVYVEGIFTKIDHAIEYMVRLAINMNIDYYNEFIDKGEIQKGDFYHSVEEYIDDYYEFHLVTHLELLTNDVYVNQSGNYKVINVF